MIKIMLVDDEPLERQGLGLILQKNRSNFEIVTEAGNGEEAVELALKHKPDLIFMDIKMPVFDGIIAIKKILAVMPKIKCIMVSAFDTFNYAQEAMKLGIKEYLLKPNKVSNVLESYDRMVNELESEKQQAIKKVEIDHRLERANSVVEMEFVISLMMNHVHEFSEKDWDQWLQLEESQGFVAVFSFDSSTLKPSRDEKSDWYRLLKQSLDEHDYHCLVGPLTGFQVPVFTLFHSDHDVTLEMRQAFARSIIHTVQNKLDQIRLLAGVGAVITNVNDFSQSYQEASYALEFVHHHQKASYLVYSPKLKQTQQALIPFKVEKALIESIKHGDLQETLQRFDSYYQLIQDASDYKVKTMKKALEDFVIVLTRSMKELGIMENFQMSFTHLETSMQIKEATKTHLSYIVEQITNWRTDGVQGLLIQAKDYIDFHFHEQISLEEVAEEIGLSSYYLSKLFKERFQITFIDYLTNTRLEKAKVLLLDSVMPLKEIALTIGYKDPNYFSRVFKKETGWSPRYYRANYQQ
ncbi:response regulator [Paraliobacillus sp. X-1268]|uniref:response regulator n=1 Tax=Paraliobacillus sp. X-1268 TaxID=2213193 RepID=UPI000E3CE50A|nr:response regulator [Paraliobacillus sp. X-1268]